MLFVFVVDTSVSMAQTTGSAMTLLDAAKGAVERFVKNRLREAPGRGDHFMLVTCAPGLEAVAAGWGAPYEVFAAALRALRPVHYTDLGSALKLAFMLLNAFRLQRESDSYTAGRSLPAAVPSQVLLVTDGSSLTSESGPAKTLTLPPAHWPGMELTREPFRWDQTVHTLVLRIPATGPPPKRSPSTPVPSEWGSSFRSPVGQTLPPDTPIPEDLLYRRISSSRVPAAAMSFVTGGAVVEAWSLKALLRAVDSMFPVIPRVHITWKIAAPDGLPDKVSPQTLASESGLILSSAVGTGMWPIPENFFPTTSLARLPPRSAVPDLHVLIKDASRRIPEGFPYDRYDVQDCALTAFMRAHPPAGAWHVFVPGSSSQADSLGYPFAMLKLTPARDRVHLYVLPYNFGHLWPLLDEAVESKNAAVSSPRWRAAMAAYFASLPCYYIRIMREAFKKFGLPPAAMPDVSQLVGYHFSIPASLKSTTAAAAKEADKFVADVNAAIAAAAPAALSDVLEDPKAALAASSAARSFGAESGAGASGDAPPPELDEIDGLSLPASLTTASLATHTAVHSTNVFDIPATELLDSLALLRSRLDPSVRLAPAADVDRFSLPIAEMGKYRAVEAAAKAQELRPVHDDEEMETALAELRKKRPQNVDEADEAAVASAPGLSRKRARSAPPHLDQTPTGPRKARKTLDPVSRPSDLAKQEPQAPPQILLLAATMTT
ncbi:uncharacterized protein AMSG_11791 [Thecamonas trahens ATCC 50062]|uniref:Uncharacterized protein n=1 Tax=Thecamonas trahens ATCC 50062 TaxID=461836 RepID=A0A0L0D6A3_THETB|nr:hypothetical protein AMSG_11791 [Thecamonas trahens ATCC 50062]KNC47725.1 hypothetical protein AMSG_11791 [Thecamonas trahens ATCC 50062]|eukprot:XP_013759368.1 hypothetical protein AMSG_11791 [Thecamonas trahens ATCC 50062]